MLYTQKGCLSAIGKQKRVCVSPVSLTRTGSTTSVGAEDTRCNGGLVTKLFSIPIFIGFLSQRKLPASTYFRSKVKSARTLFFNRKSTCKIATRDWKIKIEKKTFDFGQ